jgi:hypothetical protein
MRQGTQDQWGFAWRGSGGEGKKAEIEGRGGRAGQEEGNEELEEGRNGQREEGLDS